MAIITSLKIKQILKKQIYYGQNNLSIKESIFKIITHVLKRLQKNFDVLLQNLMHVEHFEISILKLIKKLISWKLMDRLNSNFVCFMFSLI